LKITPINNLKRFPYLFEKIGQYNKFK
jgi:hypothetical protein